MASGIEKIEYFNQPNCFRLWNDNVEIVVTTDIGPRIIAYRFRGRENILAELGEKPAIPSEFGVFHVWGGHRLWHAPENMPRSYVPDDSPVSFELQGDNCIRVWSKPERGVLIEKEMCISLAAEGTRVTIEHKLTNRGYWPVELAAWGLTVMRGGGMTIVPNEPYLPHSMKLTPARPMVLWNYTNLSDKRWIFGNRYTRLMCDESIDYPQKAGFANKQGWAGYLQGSTLFVKRFGYQEGLEYPDYGCNFETFTSGSFMEVESLGPLVKLETGATTIHEERWFLFDNVKAEDSDDGLHASICSLVEETV